MISDNKRSLLDFVDDYGFIGHKSLDKNTNKYVLDDFGDSCARTFSLLLSRILTFKFFFPGQYTELYHKALKSDFDVTSDQITLINGEPVRHPNGELWTGKSGSLSNDNMTPLLICAVLVNPVYALKLGWKLFCRAGFCFNSVYNIKGEVKSWRLVLMRHSFKYAPVADWMGFQNIAWVLRAVLQYFRQTKPNIILFSLLFVVIYPVLVALDLKLLIQSILQVVKSWFEKSGHWSTTDDLNTTYHHSALIACYPTPVSWLGRQIYGLRLPAGDDIGRYESLRHAGVYAALKSYLRDPIKHPPLHLEWKKIIYTYF